MVFFLLSSLPVIIFYKYFIFLRFVIFNLVFLFPFKLRKELFYFKKLWLSVLEVKVKHYSILIYFFEIFNTNIVVIKRSW